MTSEERPLPGITEDNARYWGSAHKRALEMPKCDSCGNVFYPSTDRCRNCLSDRLTWSAVSGKATLVTWNVMHQIYDPAFRDLAPYVVGVVRLEEGPQMISNVVHVSPKQLQVGMELKLEYLDISPEVTLPIYAPAEAGR